MNKLLLTSALLVAFLSGCGTTDGSCCESIAAVSKNMTPNGTPEKTETPYIVKTGDPVVNPLSAPEKTPPVAVITPDIQTLVGGEPVTFSCSDSYDTDENGDKIIACEWKFECHKKDGYTCECLKKGNMNIDVMITPHEDAEYMLATLTVTDNEGEHNSTTNRYEVTSQ